MDVEGRPGLAQRIEVAEEHLHTRPTPPLPVHEPAAERPPAAEPEFHRPRPLPRLDDDGVVRAPGRPRRPGPGDPAARGEEAEVEGPVLQGEDAAPILLPADLPPVEGEDDALRRPPPLLEHQRRHLDPRRRPPFRVEGPAPEFPGAEGEQPHREVLRPPGNGFHARAPPRSRLDIEDVVPAGRRAEGEAAQGVGRGGEPPGPVGRPKGELHVHHRHRLAAGVGHGPRDGPGVVGAPGGDRPPRGGGAVGQDQTEIGEPRGNRSRGDLDGTRGGGHLEGAGGEPAEAEGPAGTGGPVLKGPAFGDLDGPERHRDPGHSRPRTVGHGPREGEPPLEDHHEVAPSRLVGLRALLPPVRGNGPPAPEQEPEPLVGHRGEEEGAVGRRDRRGDAGSGAGAGAHPPDRDAGGGGAVIAERPPAHGAADGQPDLQVLPAGVDPVHLVEGALRVAEDEAVVALAERGDAEGPVAGGDGVGGPRGGTDETPRSRPEGPDLDPRRGPSVGGEEAAAHGAPGPQRDPHSLRRPPAGDRHPEPEGKPARGPRRQGHLLAPGRVDAVHAEGAVGGEGDAQAGDLEAHRHPLVVHEAEAVVVPVVVELRSRHGVPVGIRDPARDGGPPVRVALKPDLHVLHGNPGTGRDRRGLPAAGLVVGDEDEVGALDPLEARGGRGGDPREHEPPLVVGGDEPHLPPPDVAVEGEDPGPRGAAVGGEDAAAHAKPGHHGDLHGRRRPRLHLRPDGAAEAHRRRVGDGVVPLPRPEGDRSRAEALDAEAAVGPRVGVADGGVQADARELRPGAHHLDPRPGDRRPGRVPDDPLKGAGGEERHLDVGPGDRPPAVPGSGEADGRVEPVPGAPRHGLDLEGRHPGHPPEEEAAVGAGPELHPSLRHPRRGGDCGLEERTGHGPARGAVEGAARGGAEVRQAERRPPGGPRRGLDGGAGCAGTGAPGGDAEAPAGGDPLHPEPAVGAGLRGPDRLRAPWGGRGPFAEDGDARPGDGGAVAEEDDDPLQRRRRLEEDPEDLLPPVPAGGIRHGAGAGEARGLGDEGAAAGGKALDGGGAVGGGGGGGGGGGWLQVVVPGDENARRGAGSRAMGDGQHPRSRHRGAGPVGHEDVEG